MLDCNLFWWMSSLQFTVVNNLLWCENLITPLWQKKNQKLCNLENQLSHFNQVLTNVIYNNYNLLLDHGQVPSINVISSFGQSHPWCWFHTYGDLDLYDQLHLCNVIQMGSFFLHAINVSCVGNEIHIVKFHPCDPIPSALFIPTLVEVSSTWFNFM